MCKKLSLVLACLLLFSVTPVMAQDYCDGDFDNDLDQDGTDAAVFKSDFGRNKMNEPCPPPVTTTTTPITTTIAPGDCPEGTLDCNGYCVYCPDTDENNCGSCGNTCASNEKCVAGVCEACSPAAGVPKTGQIIGYANRDDGNLQKGVTWPNPRFTDNGNGTVTDNLTGLIWLKNANCFGTRTWSNALSDCNGLASGSCGLTDGSIAGDWRLPNRFELESLIDLGYFLPAVPNTAGTGQWSEGNPFTSLLVDIYWSSTTVAASEADAWVVIMGTGGLDGTTKVFNEFFVWPVRGGVGQPTITSTTTVPVSTTTTIAVCGAEWDECTVSSDCCNGCCCYFEYGGLPYQLCVIESDCESELGGECDSLPPSSTTTTEPESTTTTSVDCSSNGALCVVPSECCSGCCCDTPPGSGRYTCGDLGVECINCDGRPTTTSSSTTTTVCLPEYNECTVSSDCCGRCCCYYEYMGIQYQECTEDWKCEDWEGTCL